MQLFPEAKARRSVFCPVFSPVFPSMMFVAERPLDVGRRLEPLLRQLPDQRDHALVSALLPRAVHQLAPARGKPAHQVPLHQGSRRDGHDRGYPSARI
jgi:hypothetical protein